MSYPYAVQRILDRYQYLKPEDVTQRLRYSTFISVPKRYMYFEVPKAACTMMKELLRTLENAPPIELLGDNLLETRRDMFIHARKNVPLPSLMDLDDKTQKEVLVSPDFLRMTFVRNPYTRLISAWKNKVMLCEPGNEKVYIQIKGGLPALRQKSLVTFDQFVEYVATQCDLRTCNPHWRRQSDHIFFSALDFSFVGKVEHVAEGLRRFEQHLGFSHALVADSRNVSRGSDGEVYNRCLADKVYLLYQADFETLSYDRGAWPAGQSDSREISKKCTVPEEIFNDEIIERNLIISLLYQERDQLRADLQKVLRFRLLAVADTLLVFRNLRFKFLSSIKAWIHRGWHR
jgi:hypothetical protein